MLYTLVNEIVGKETPRKKPKIIPRKVVARSLIVSFGFLFPLQVQIRITLKSPAAATSCSPNYPRIAEQLIDLQKHFC